MKSAIIGIVALASLLASVSSIRVYRYDSDDCTGTAITFTVNNDECLVGNGTASQGHCNSLSSDSEWSVSFHNNETCDGAADTAINGNGLGCETVGITSIKVDCGSSSDSCFAGDSVVIKEGGQRVEYQTLQTGDNVLAVKEDGTLFFDTVFRRTSWHPARTASMVTVETERGQKLQLAPNHYLHVNDCCSLNTLTLAKHVQVGDALFHVEDGIVVKTTVTKVSIQLVTGMYNAHTLSGNIVVNDIVASHFTQRSGWTNRDFATWWYRFIHALHKLHKYFGL